MSKKTLLIAVSLVGLAACNQKGANHTPKSEDEKAFYSIGYSMGARMKGLNMNDGEIASVAQGLKDAIKGANEQVKVADYRQKIPALMKERMTKAAESTKKKGADFVAKFAKEPGVQKTDTGLHFKVEKEGTGATAKATDTVEVHYHGTLIDGTVFDSSKDRGEPIKFPLNRVIKCWTEGVPKIKVGGKVRLVCPPDIAYGDGGAGPKIPGGSTLIFDVELLSIVKKEAGKK